MPKTPIKLPADMLSMFAKPQPKPPSESVTEIIHAATDKAAKESAQAAQSEAQATPPSSAGNGSVDESKSRPAVGEPAVAARTPEEPKQLQDLAALNTSAKLGADGFRKLLDDLDAQMKEQLTDLSLGLARNMVKRTMIELREFPEYAGIVKDGDVRNIFIFLRSTVAAAKEDAATLKDKSARREAKRAAKGIPQKIVIDDLDMLGNLNTSDVNALLGIKK